MNLLVSNGPVVLQDVIISGTRCGHQLLQCRLLYRLLTILDDYANHLEVALLEFQRAGHREYPPVWRRETWE